MPDLAGLLNFSHPHFLFGMAVPVIILATSYLKNIISINRYCDKALLPWVTENNKESPVKRILHGKILVIISWSLICLALAGPRINIDVRSPANKNIYDTATIIVLDISRSMLAEDVYPNRISKAKLLINSLLYRSTHKLFSLIVYANEAHTVIPLTYDSNVIKSVLKSIQPNMLPVEGSSFESGLNLAVKLLNESAVKNKSIILLTDGDFDQKKIPPPSDAHQKIKLTIFGIGTPEGQAIPLKEGGWLSFNNQPVISQLNEVNLEKIAKHYGGIYQTIKSNIKPENIKLATLPTSAASIKPSNNTVIIWKQVYHWFLIPALLLYLLSTLSTTRTLKLFRSRLTSTSQNIITAITLTGLFIIFSTAPSLSKASETSNNKINLAQANTAYFNKNYIKAEALYKTATGFDALFGLANSLYKQKNYLNAAHLYMQAVLSATDNVQRAKAIYNLANSYYIIGDYPKAINLYRDTLKYNPTFEKAKINLKYAIALDIKVKHALELRKGKKQSRESRAGSGTRFSNVEQGIDIGSSKVILDDDNEKVTFYHLPLNDELANQLISRGIKYSQISSTVIDKTTENKNWNFEYTTLDMVQLLVQQEKMDNFKLWKRLFEIEEGFPAPVDEPLTKPGVNPW